MLLSRSMIHRLHSLVSILQLLLDLWIKPSQIQFKVAGYPPILVDAAIHICITLHRPPDPPIHARSHQRPL
ncbi:hypothetical protein KCU86_g1, partial [Aureobasidium melanogenum]